MRQPFGKVDEAGNLVFCQPTVQVAPDVFKCQRLRGLRHDLGGYGFAAEYDIERKFRETRLYLVAPISTNLIFAYIAEHVLGLPRSF